MLDFSIIGTVIMTDQNKAYLYTACVVAIWATVASAFKISLRYLNYIQLLALSSFISLIVLLVLLLAYNKLKLLKTYTKKDYIRSVLLGLCNPFFYYLVLFKAYELLPAQEAQPLNQTWAIVLALLSIIILRQKITIKSIIALTISFIGVFMISTHGHVWEFEFSNLGGVLLALGSAFIWAIFWLYNMKDKRDTVTKLFLNFLFGSFFIIVFLLITKQSLRAEILGYIGALYVGIFEMGITFVLWLKALKLSKTTAQVSNIIYLVPFLSLVIIHFAVGEKILASTIIGLVFIITGILVQQYSSKHIP
jgi:drug/metabolite transporter (DMT)-like permease